MEALQQDTDSLRRMSPEQKLTVMRTLIRQAWELKAAAIRARLDVGPAGEWLLDNFHVVQEHIREVRRAAARLLSRAARAGPGPLAGYPRVYELAITLISHTEGGRRSRTSSSSSPRSRSRAALDRRALGAAGHAAARR
jgi:cyclic beta-1,2-glucan synthetase